MSPEPKNVIISIETEAGVPRAEIETVVKTQTGSGDIFFCPDLKEGKPYSGHAHVFPPPGAVDASDAPIIIKKS